MQRRFSTYFLAVLVVMILFTERSLVAQGDRSFYQNRMFESFIESVHQSGLQNVENADAEVLQSLARSHYERARIYEKMYEMTLHSSKRMLEVMSEEANENVETDAIHRIQLRIEAQNQKELSNTEIENLGIVEKALIQRTLSTQPSEPCHNSLENSRLCEILVMLSNGSGENYLATYNLLKDVQLTSNEDLLNRLAERSRLSDRGELVIQWLNTLQVQFLADYTMAGWLYETLGRPEAYAAYFRAKKWRRFETPIDRPEGPIQLYRQLGYQANSANQCEPSALSDQFKSLMNQNAGLFLYSVEAMKSCASPGTLKKEYFDRLRSFKPRNREQAQLLAEALYATNSFQSAHDKITSRVSRNDFFNMSRTTPLTLSTIALLQYVIGGDENWREARELLIILQNEFKGLSPASLILQLATQSEFRKSINIYID